MKLRLGWLAAAALLAGATPGAPASGPAASSPSSLARALAGARGPEAAPTRTLDGVPYVGANDLARLLNATKYWRADVRKLELRAGDHRIQLTADNPFVLIDDATRRLPSDVRSLGGELQVPVALVDSLPRDSTLARLLFDPARRVVLQVPPAGLIGTPRIAPRGAVTRLVIPMDHPEALAVASRARAHFRLHLGGFFVGSLPESLPPASLVRAIRTIPSATGTAFELELALETAGFEVARDPARGRATLTFSSRPSGPLEALAPEGPPGPRRVRVVVLDPGHGGADAGVTAGDAVEKNLTLALARLVKLDLERRLAARVLLTRDDDRDLTEQERAELANRAHADLFLSLHFDGFAGPAARGATAYCPPATFGSRVGLSGHAGEFTLLPWRDVATRHAALSRDLADDLLSALELRGLGPTRLREILPYTMLGVNAPGLLVECATLTSPADRERVMSQPGLAELAAGIVDGVEAYARGR